MVIFTTTDNSATSFELLRELIEGTKMTKAIPIHFREAQVLFSRTNVLVIVDRERVLSERILTPEFSNEVLLGTKKVIYLTTKETEEPELIDNGKIFCREVDDFNPESLVPIISEIRESQKYLNLV